MTDLTTFIEQLNTSSAQTLADMSEELKKSVGVFKTGNN